MGIRRKPDSAQQAESEQAQPGNPGGEQQTALEHRLEALIESERVEGELLEQLRAERWTAEQQDSERRLAAIEEALEEARAGAEERKEMQKALG